MSWNLPYQLWPSLSFLFIGMLILLETGRRLAVRRCAKESEGERSSLGTVEGAVFALLFVLGLICSLLAGYRMVSGQQRSWLHILGFTVITVIIVYVVLDIEYPRAGLIRIEAADQVLVELRADLK